MEDITDDKTAGTKEESFHNRIHRELLNEALSKLQEWDGASVRDLKKLADPAYSHARDMAAEVKGDQQERKEALELALLEVDEALRDVAGRGHPAIPDREEIVTVDASGAALCWRFEEGGVSVDELDEEEWAELLSAHNARMRALADKA